MRFNVVIRVEDFNEGKNKYALAINSQNLDILANAINNSDEYALINGIKLRTKNPEMIKIYRVKTKHDHISNDDLKDLMNKEARAFFNGKLNIRILRNYGEDVTDQFIKSKTQNITSYKWDFIHPVIRDISIEKFEDQYYADAVESAFKELNDIIKIEYRKVSGVELDGASLMRSVFSVKQPIFKLSPNLTESDRSLQQGYMDIFAGAMQGIRNPKAHSNLDISEIDAWEKIVLSSHLMKIWDKRII